ncbi:hypothetical protein ACH42_12180 [Endozoicomonas sp. (ex Bugula neritina AB1)]|nr:hypothetical protein ACH42_12180 [Endozoicomonas sp. (ex Bugula neritina AB1)]
MVSDPLKILFVVSELAGIVKTGGLADVAGALGPVMRKLGHDVRVVLPAYQKALANLTTKVVSVGEVNMNAHQSFGFAVHEAEFEGVPIYLIEHNNYFDRPGLYTYDGEGFGDNAERFAFFSRAALEVCQLQGFQPNVIHCHDWPTALLPYYLKVHESLNPFFINTRTVLTIHNGAYQEHTSSALLDALGIDWRYFNSECFEDYGQINLLKGGIAFADKITTVSPQYAKELLSELGSHGLMHSFRSREKDFYGILNGCDYQHWDPKTDHLLPANYSLNDLEGKSVCKQALQDRMQLPVDLHKPVFGLVSRLANQKGFDFLIPALWRFLEQDVQLVLLGSGDKHYAAELQRLADAFPDKCRFFNGYSDELAHWIEAGSDFFLMPSLFEPCGLNQIYSMKYGTLPIVRAVGGLIDSVSGYAGDANTATGFLFDGANADELHDCLMQAITVYHDKTILQALIFNAMSESFSWDAAAKEYIKVYRATL